MKKGKLISVASTLGATAVALMYLVVALPGVAGPRQEKPGKAAQSQIAHGEYLVKSVAQCGDCHTPRDAKGQFIQEQWLKGNKLPFTPTVQMPWAGVAPDIAGLRGWTSEQAIHFLTTGLDRSGHPPLPPMPEYRMNHTDAAAVVAYLKSLQ